MLYLIEVYKSFFYVFVSFIVSFFCFYLSKNLFLIFLFSNTFYKTFLFEPTVIEKSFIISFTETLLSAEIVISLVLACLVTFPILLYAIRCFIIPSLSLHEYNFTFFQVNMFLINLYLYNYLVFFQLGTQFWCFSETLNFYLITNNYLTIEYEPDLSSYFLFMYCALKLLNFTFLLLFIFYCIFKRSIFKIFIQRFEKLKILIVFTILYILFSFSFSWTLFFITAVLNLLLIEQIFFILKLISIFKQTHLIRQCF